MAARRMLKKGGSSRMLVSGPGAYRTTKANVPKRRKPTSGKRVSSLPRVRSTSGPMVRSTSGVTKARTPVSRKRRSR